MIRAQASIHRAALAHNLQRVRDHAPGRAVYAAVKADGYGHGAVTVALALSDADGFAVSSIEEALQLRWAGLAKPVALLSQMLDTEACDAIAGHALEVVVFHDAQLEALARHIGLPVRVWIKLDTGMHRLGFDCARADEIERRLSGLDAVEIVGWLTHLACADDPADALTSRQLAAFTKATGKRAGRRSIANSAGVLAWPDAHADVVRPGIMLYGSSPMVDRSAAELDLKPVMHLTAPLIAHQTLGAGEPVGYGATWRTPETMPVGVVGIGYGDGYPRHAPAGTPVLLGGVRVPLIGRVSMDMITVDLRDAPDAQVGDRATLWGPGLPADEIAAAADTIAYELFCQLTPRVLFDIR